MELIEGKTVKETIFGCEQNYSTDEMIRIANLIGIYVGKLHSQNIIHGDLTTSNFMIREGNGSLVMIDFGLSYISTLVEDKAVDLYVLERAFSSLHPDSESMFATILESYENSHPTAVQVIKRLEKVRARGRKKLAFG